MKTIYLFILILVSGICMAQTNENLLANIKKKYSEINKNIFTFTVKETESDQNSLEGGYIKGFYKDSLIQLIIEEDFGETFKQRIEYYFADNQFIFVLEQFHKYNVPAAITKEQALKEGYTEWFDPKKTKISSKRFYFANQTLIRWINEKNVIEKNEKKKFSLKQQEIIDRVNTIKNLLK
jgi:hypothetical protein